MNEINQLNETSLYYSGVQSSVSEAAKEKKKEKISKTGRTSFSKILKSQQKEENIYTNEFPPEIENLDFENAAIYLRDQIDYAGKELEQSQSTENLERFKQAVGQFLKYMTNNNFELHKKQLRGFRSPVNHFSTFNTQPHPKEPRVQIQVINEKLDEMTKDVLFRQAGNLKILKQIEEIKGLIVDLMSN
jgi:uncharacterized protein YaaR (DUF327 family)